MRKNLVRLVRPTVDSDTYTWATVTDDSPLRIQLDGADDPLGFAPDTLVGGLQIGDRVWVQLATNANPTFRARRAYILGKSGGVDLSAIESDIADLQSDVTGLESDVGTLQTSVTALTPVYAQLRRAAVQSINNNTNTAVSWDTAVVDSHNGWDSSPNPTRWTCPSGCAGWYAYSGILSFAVNATSTRAVRILKNGGSVNGAQVILNGSASASTLSMFHGGLIQLDEGDYVEVNAFQFSGAALNTGTGLQAPTLNLHRIAA